MDDSTSGTERASHQRAAQATLHLRLLTTTHTTPPRRPDGQPRTRTAGSAPPISLALLDHLERTAREIDAYLAAQSDPAGPAPLRTPRNAEGLYRHLEAEAARLGIDDAARARVRDAMVVRQGLEHAIAGGDDLVIRRHACGRCNCWSLFWDDARRLARCTNRLCAERNGGMVAGYTLAQLAEMEVAKTPSRRAT